jgi:hypothetical protein
MRNAYIRVLTDLLDDVLIEVARVAEEATSDVVGVLETVEDLVDHGRLRALLQVHLDLLGGGVDVLHPGVVVLRGFVVDMIFELDHVAVGDVFGVGGGDDGSSIVVDGAHDDWRGSSQQWQGEADKRPHDGGLKMREDGLRVVVVVVIAIRRRQTKQWTKEGCIVLWRKGWRRRERVGKSGA